LALATLSILPFFGMLAAPRDEMIALRAAPRIVRPPAAEPSVPPRPPRPPPRRPELRSRPKLERPRQRINALEARLSLSMSSLMVGIGDIALDFAVEAAATPDSLSQESLVFSLGELDSIPRPLVRTRPLYPVRARQEGIEGSVELEFVVTAEGRAANLRVVRSEPAGAFDRAAVRAVERWRFVPGKKDGVAVSCRVRQVIRFRVEGR
jgi:protein TonB